MTNPNGTLTRERFLAAATHLHETEAESGALSLGTVWIRELTARQRLDMSEAARQRDANGDAATDANGNALYDDAVYRALAIVSGLIDGPGGALVLSPADVPVLVEQGRECLRMLTTHILNLSWLTEGDLKSAGAAANSEERSTAESAEDIGDTDGAPGAR